MPIGDLDSDDLSVLGGALFGAAADIPPAIGELKRRMLLARLIMAAPRPRRPARRHHPPGPGRAAGGGTGAAAGPGRDRAQGSVGPGRAGAGEPGRALAAHHQLPRHPAPRVAGDPGGRRRHRSRRPAQPPARPAARGVGSSAADRADHRGGFDRLDPGGRRPHAHHRAPAARRGLSAGPRPRAERRGLAGDRGGSEPSAVRPGAPADSASR